MAATRAPAWRPPRLPGNRRLHVAVAAVLAALFVAVAAIALIGGSPDRPPPDGAARLVPADALVFVHLSTDPSRPATGRALGLAQRFPGYEALRDRVLRRLNVRRCGLTTSELRGGREAALALLNAKGGTAGSLVLIDTGRPHAAAQQRACGAVAVRYIGPWLAIGQPGSLAQAAQLAAGRGRPLADAPAYRKGTDGLPAGRVADAWVTADGARRLLTPQGGVLGAIGGLLDRPDLAGAALALRGAGHAAHLTVRSVLTGRAADRMFEPRLAGMVPDDAIAYLGSRGIGRALTTVLGFTGAGIDVNAAAGALRGVSQRLRAVLGADADGEVAVFLEAGIPAPTLTLVAGAGKDAAATGRALRGAEAPFARALVGPRGKAPAFRSAKVGGRDARVLGVAGFQIAYAVFDGRLVASTKLDGIGRVAAGGRSLPSTEGFKATVGKLPHRVGSLVFVDFSQLLRLAEQTGLNDSRSYQAVKADLQRVDAIGGSTTSAGDLTTTELALSIP